MDDTHLDAQDELDRLRVENAALREQLTEEGRSEHARGRWRWPLAVVLLVIGGVALAASTLAVWSGRTLLDTDRYVETVTPLIDSPAIRASVAQQATERIFGSIDVENRAREALPPRADFLAPSITSNLESFARSAAEDVLATPQARQLWIEANRRSHERIVPALLGEADSRFVDVTEGTVSLDGAEIVSRVKEGLTSRGISIAGQVPNSVAGEEITLFQSQGLANVQSGLQFLRSAMFWLPALTLLAFAGAIAASPDRRRATLWLGVATIAAMILLAVGVALLRDAYVSTGNRVLLDASAAAVMFDTLFRFLRNAIRVLAAIGLVIALAAALAGPSRAARAIRGATTDGVGGVARRTGLDLGGFSTWVDAHDRALDAAGVVLAAIVLLSVGTPTPGLVLGLTLGVVVWLLIVEVLAHAHGPGSETRRPTAQL